MTSRSGLMFISEIFESFQGEGPWAGTPSLFIRTSGCNLRCWFCDTPYTSWNPEGEQKSLDELQRVVEACSAGHVVITGGEPMLAPQLTELTELCRAAGRTITIETAGTVDRSVECDLMAISPKLENSTPEDAHWSVRHEETRHQPAVIRSLLTRYDGILKFVIDSSEDISGVLAYLRDFPMVSPDRVWLMPQARTAGELAEKTQWIQQAAEESGFRFSPRLHVERYGDRRGV
ncbi:MAG: 7-carboxy-7-deazaguanine synthase QueE [Planctomycetaceae bacterium]